MKAGKKAGTKAAIRFQAATGFLAAAFAVWLVSSYWGSVPWLAAVAVLVFLAALLQERAWLFILPFLLPLLDFSPWTGAFLWIEFDIAVLATIAGLGLRAWHVGAPTGQGRLDIFFLLLGASFLWGLAVSLDPFPDINANTLSDYKSPLYALRVAKGFFWVWLLLPHLRAALKKDFDAASGVLVAGLLAGLAATGLFVMWERGVLAALVHWQGIYYFADALLDFSSEYRITANFGSMNTGGTAVDGYLSLSVPLAAYAVLFGKTGHYRIAALAALGLGLYALLATFSRGLYGGFAVSLAVMAASLVYRHRDRAGDYAGIAALGAAFAAILTAVFSTLYSLGGYGAMGMAFLGLVLGAAGGVALKGRVGPAAQGLIGLVIVLIALGLFDQIRESRWSETGSLEAITIGTAVAAFIVPSAFWLARRPQLRAHPGYIFSAIGAMGLLWIGALPAFQGYRMEVRFGASGEDIFTRLSHWQDGMSLVGDDPLSVMFGEGTGSFPRLYFARKMGSTELVNYRIVEAGGGNGPDSFLELGSGDFSFTQKLRIESRARYHLSLTMRSPAGEGRASMKICPKHILYSDRWVPACAKAYFKLPEGAGWQTYEVDVDSTPLGAIGPLSWPPTIMLYNGTRERTVQIGRVSLKDERGREHIRNGDFSGGMRSWYFISDFRHLAWHEKDLLLHVYIELGIVGLMIFAAAAAAAVQRCIRALRAEHDMALGLLPAIVGFFLVGLFGTMIDAPQIAFLYFFLLATALHLPIATGRPVGNSD